ncbi:4'-phosphopantetheinyl transferase superfamily protein [Flavobacteriaceae bacterium Ap0902]|nr:4'-phosphopantetheinyl transferase superfamily protein [Flavobacteriaceae bacterium Ap0902]
MPIIDYINDAFTEIVTWHVTETEDELLEHVSLTPERTKKCQKMPQKQRMEYLGLRACLKKLNFDLDVHYDERGKPYLNIDKHLSITHSYHLVSVGVSSFLLGIDIEKKRDKKIRNVARKFIRKDEDAWIPKDMHYPEYLHIIWGIKEGLYKLNGGNLWNFLHHYRVEPFNIQDNKNIVCWISDESSSRKYYAYHKMIGKHYLVWVLDYEA